MECIESPRILVENAQPQASPPRDSHWVDLGRELGICLFVYKVISMPNVGLPPTTPGSRVTCSVPSQALLTIFEHLLPCMYLMFTHNTCHPNYPMKKEECTIFIPILRLIYPRCTRLATGRGKIQTHVHLKLLFYLLGRRSREDND